MKGSAAMQLHVNAVVGATREPSSGGITASWNLACIIRSAGSSGRSRVISAGAAGRIGDEPLNRFRW